ncbi:MAG: hypothetical protein ABL308_03035 [Oceanicaulis sp.]
MLDIFGDDAVRDLALRYAAWAALIAGGLLPLVWAVQQRFGGGLSTAMGAYSKRTRRGAPCQKKQCFLDNLDRDIDRAEKVRRSRMVYTAGYIAAVLAPGVALAVYALNQPFFAPGATAPFVDPDGAAASPGVAEVVRFFFLSSNFIAMLAEQLAQDIPGAGGLAASLIGPPPIIANPDAQIFAGLTTAFKWVSGPALLLSGVVIADLWGGFRHIGGVVDRYRKAKEAVAGMADGEDAEKYKRKIARTVAVQEG